MRKPASFDWREEREWELAARDNPNDRAVLMALAEVYGEQGESGKAARILSRIASEHPEDAVARSRATDLAMEAEPDASRSANSGPDGGQEISPAQLVRFLALYSGREDTYARQWWDPKRGGGYAPVREPLTPSILKEHLAGRVTVGVYPIRVDGTVTFLALDFDITRRAIDQARGDVERSRVLRRAVAKAAVDAAGTLEQLGLPVLLEDSGYKGRHLWVFLERPEMADLIFRLGSLLARRVEPDLPPGIHVESFPRQASHDTQAAGLGNLIKLPLGIHRRTGRRCHLLARTGAIAEDPWGLLGSARRASRDAVHGAVDALERAGLSPRHPRKRAEEPAAPRFEPEDLDRDAEIAHVLERCPVLDAIVRGSLRTRRLTRSEQLVVIHSIGHTPRGPDAVNLLLDNAVNLSPRERMGAPLSGNPISCPKIRKRVPEVTSRVDCSCTFPFAPDDYPSPLLHLRTLAIHPELAQAHRDLDGLGETYLDLERRKAALESELDRLRATAGELLARGPDRAVRVHGGRWKLVKHDGSAKGTPPPGPEAVFESGVKAESETEAPG